MANQADANTTNSSVNEKLMAVAAQAFDNQDSSGTNNNTPPGTEKSGPSTSYGKVILYYSGSVISPTSFANYGYQNTFDWKSNRFLYATNTVTYATIGVYTEVGLDIFATEIDADGTTDDAYTYEYEWVYYETDPTCDYFIEDYSLHVHDPRRSGEGLSTAGQMVDFREEASGTEERTLYGDGGMGIIAEAEMSYEETQGYLNNKHIHEESFTANGNNLYSFSSTTDSIGAGSCWNEFSVPLDEQKVISRIFGTRGGETDTRTLMEELLENFSLTFYETLFIAKNTYPAKSPKQMQPANLRRISVLESQYNAPVDPADDKVVDPTTEAGAELITSGFDTAGYE